MRIHVKKDIREDVSVGENAREDISEGVGEDDNDDARENVRHSVSENGREHYEEDGAWALCEAVSRWLRVVDEDETGQLEQVDDARGAGER